MITLHFEGAARLNASRSDIFARLTDARLLADSIPSVGATRVVDESKVETKLDLDAPGIESQFKVEVVVAEAAPPDSVKLTSNGAGAGSKLDVKGSFNLLGDSPTWVHWTADAQVEGAIEKLDQNVLKSIGDRKAEELFGELGRAVESGSG